MANYRKSGGTVSRADHSALSGAGVLSHEELERRLGLLEEGSLGEASDFLAGEGIEITDEGDQVKITNTGVRSLKAGESPQMAGDLTLLAGQSVSLEQDNEAKTIQVSTLLPDNIVELINNKEGEIIIDGEDGVHVRTVDATEEEPAKIMIGLDDAKVVTSVTVEAVEMTGALTFIAGNGLSLTPGENGQLEFASTAPEVIPVQITAGAGISVAANVEEQIFEISNSGVRQLNGRSGIIQIEGKDGITVTEEDREDGASAIVLTGPGPVVSGITIDGSPLNGAVTIQEGDGIDITRDGNVVTIASSILPFVLNGLTGNVTLAAGPGLDLVTDAEGKLLTLGLAGSLSLVSTINGISGGVSIAGGNGNTIQIAGNVISVNAPNSVRSLTVAGQQLIGALSLLAGANINLTTSGGNITISAIVPLATTVNGSSGAITINAGLGISVNKSGLAVTVANTGVLSLNGGTGALNLVAANGLAISRSGQNITITAPDRVSGIRVNSTTLDNLVNVTAGAGIALSISGNGFQIASSLTQATTNGMTGNVEILAGPGISVVKNASNKTLTISASIGSFVSSLNNRSGAVNIAGANGCTVSVSGQTITINGPGAGVSSITAGGAALNGALTLSGGTGVSITRSGNTIVFASTLTVPPATSVNGKTGSVQLVAGTGINITNPSGSNLRIDNLGVTSVNSITGGVTVNAGSGLKLVKSGSTLTMSLLATSGVASVNGSGGAININGGSGIAIDQSGGNLTIRQSSNRFHSIWNTNANGQTVAAEQNIALVAGPGIQLNLVPVDSQSHNLTISATQGGGSGVTSVNGYTGNVQIIAGAGIVVENAGSNQIRIKAVSTGGSGNTNLIAARDVFGPWMEMAIQPNTTYVLTVRIPSAVAPPPGDIYGQFDFIVEGYDPIANKWYIIDDAQMPGFLDVVLASPPTTYPSQWSKTWKSKPGNHGKVRIQAKQIGHPGSLKLDCVLSTV